MDRLRDFDLLRDQHALLELWDHALGDRYPVTPRVLHACVAGRPSYEAGDAVVIEDDGRLVGFALMELDRGGGAVGIHASVSAILVHPARQRQGLGTRLLGELENRMRQAGCRHVRPAQNASRFWSGVPEDLTAALAFFRKHGYDLKNTVWDLLVPLGNFAASLKYQDRLTTAGAQVVPCTREDLGEAMGFQVREFPGWVNSTLRMAAAGDLGNFLLVKRQGQIIGSIQTYTPHSRWRAPNLVWERLHGQSMGGYGAVGIGEKSRGLGLGAAMCEAAALHVERNGATCALIDWTGLVDFYAKVGAKPWRKFHAGPKDL